VTVIVGDNGVGKTALLEAIMLALSSSPVAAWRLKQTRGFDGAFRGTRSDIEETFVGDYFHLFDMEKPISIELRGEGAESRTLKIEKGRASTTVHFNAGEQSQEIDVPIQFTWTDNRGTARTVAPKISPTGIAFDDTGEQLPHFFFFGASQPILASETAERFSALSKKNKEKEFVKMFSKEYPWIQDLTVQASTGVPMLYATVAGAKQKIPINATSSAVARVLTILLSLCARKGGVLSVDEIENGIYHKHQERVWKMILDFSKEYSSQIFVTSHSAEALYALQRAAGDEIEDIAFWRLERGDDQQISLSEFEGKDFSLALDYNYEVR
jgi:hypothetical protein